MQHKCIQLTLLIMAWLLMGCTVVSRTAAPPGDIATQEVAFIYGYVEAEKDIIDRVDFVEYGKVYIPPFKKPPRVLVYDNGFFMAENIVPGKYVISGFRSERNHYNMARSTQSAYQKIFRIMPGDMTYLGSFNVRVTQRGDIKFGKFKVMEIQRPGERDVLKHLYRVTEGTAWQNKIARRLKQLQQL